MSRVKKKWLFHQEQVIFISIQNKEVNESYIGFSSDVYIFYMTFCTSIRKYVEHSKFKKIKLIFKKLIFY